MSLFNVYPRFKTTLSKAKGVYVFDDEGQQFLDLYGGHGVISIGHGHPYFLKKLKQQLDDIVYYSNSVQMPLQEAVAAALQQDSGYLKHRVFLCNSGAEANENAIKIASFHTSKKKVIAFKKSFHGRTTAALNVTDNPKLSAAINTNNFPVTFLDINDEQQLSTALETDDICAVIIEGIQGVGGLDIPTDQYLRFLSASCKAKGVVLILDEIQSGFGRSGWFFAHQSSGIEADVITMAKGMGNGFPVGGLLIHPDIQASYGLLGTTFGGNHLACVATSAVLQVMKEEHLMENATKINQYLTEELKAISSIKTIKGKGLMLGLEFDFKIKKLREKILYEHHIFTGSSANPNLLRILPPLCITEEEISPFIEVLKKV